MQHTTISTMKKSSGWNQEVTDDKGRRRFHGAFTGGFSAGYFNSVGSKEGWQPKTFSSSQQNRGGTVQQRAEDFMDEDDDPLLGKRLETTQQYDPLHMGGSRHGQRGAHAAPVADKPRNAFEAHVLQFNNVTSTPVQPPLAMTFLDEFMVPVNDSIGAKLLSRMGWKEGHGIGPRIRKRKFEDTPASSAAASIETTAEKSDDHAVVYIPPRNTIDVSAFPKPKLDKYGAGFDPYVNAPEFSRYKQQTTNAQQQMLEKRQVVTFSDAMKATTGSYATTTGFGLSALEENDDLDVYGSVSMAEFDTAIGSAALANGDEIKMLDSEAQESRGGGRRPPTFCTDGRPALAGFELAYAKEKPPKAVVLRLEVPSTFKWYHHFDDDNEDNSNENATFQMHNFTTGKHGRGSLMTVKQRAVLLGESAEDHVNASSAPQPQTKETSGSVFEMLGDVQKARLYAAVAQSKMQSQKEPLPVPKVREPLVKGAAGDQFRANITASIAKRFVSASSSSNDAQETKAAGMSNATSDKPSYRTQSEWIPSSLLCKRFHVKCLSASATAISREEDKKRDLFDKELVPHLVEFAAGRQRDTSSSSTLVEHTGNAVASTATNATKPLGAVRHGDDDLPPLPTVERPAASLLKSIFEPSDESEVEEDDEDAEEDSSDDEGDDGDDATRTEADLIAPKASSVDGRTQPSLSAIRDPNSVTSTTKLTPNETKRYDLETERRRDRATATADATSDSSESDSSEEDAKKKKKKKHKKKHSSSKSKKSSKHKKRSRAYSEDDDDASDDSASDDRRRKHRSSKKKDSKKHSSSLRKRSRSRDRSTSRHSKHRRH
ncbi:hypothetical protein FI667_g6604, partial [Globisporangium splendens]